MDGPWTQFAPQAAPAESPVPAPAASDGPWTLFKPAAPVAPNQDAGLNEYGITGDPQQFNGALTPAEQGIANVTGAVAEGAKAGFGQGPLGISPKTDDALVKVGVFNGSDENNPLKGLNRAIVAPIAAAGDLALRTGGALVGAYQRGISQAGEEVGAPQLGRDLAALPEAFPTGDLGGGTRIAQPAARSPEAPAVEVGGVAQFPVTAQSVMENPPFTVRPSIANDSAPNPLALTPSADVPAFVPPGATFPENPTVYPAPRFIPPVPENVPSRAPLAPQVVQSSSDLPKTAVASPVRAPPVALNALLPNAAVSTRSARTNALLPPSVGLIEPVPQSVGSAASRDLSHPSSIAMAPRDAAASQATGENWRLAQPAVQGIDKTEYVKGVVPTAAEVAGNADVSAQQKYMMQTPGQVEKFRAQQAANNDRRIDHYDELAGTPTIVDTMKDARSAQADADLKGAWGNKQPVDAQPVVDQIDAVLAGPQGKLSAVRSALKSVRDTLHDADGKIETDPEVLYGARREVAAMLGKAAQQEKPTLRDAASQLGNVKDALDQTIEKGAPGYQKYLQNYAEASRPIDARELLLDARPGLTNGADRMLSFAKVDRLMRDIVAKRQASGVNPAKSLTDEQMEGLWNLHSDLKRLGNIDLGRPRGSDTSALGRMGGALGLGGAHVVANALLPVAGSFLVHEGKSLIAGRAINRRVNRLLDGPNYRP
jgi:hypothetical protein